MFKATYHIIKNQFSSLYIERSTYAKIFLAPLSSYIVFILLVELLSSMSAKTTNYSTHMNIELAIILLTFILVPLMFIYAIKGLVQTIRHIVLKETPTAFFGIYLFKQSYLLVIYFLFFFFAPSSLMASSNIIISFFVLLYAIYALTWYPYNLVSAAADVPVDFFRVGLKIGKWAFMNLMILIFFVILYVAILANLHNLPNALLLFLTYFVILNHLGCYARSYMDCDNLR